MPYVDIVGQSYQLDERNLSGQRTINWHMEIYGDEDDSTKSKTALKPVPGGRLERLMSAVTTDTCRGMYVSSKGPTNSNTARLYGCWGTTVYRFSENFTPYALGDVAKTGEDVSMIDNGLDFVIVDGIKCYKSSLLDVDGSATLTEVTLPLGGGTVPQTIRPTHISFMKQRLVVNNRDADTFYYSKLALTEFDAVNNFDFYSAEQYPDNILALQGVAGRIWAFGPRSVEIWGEGPSSSDPFAYIGGSTQNIGIYAPYSVAALDDKVFWFGASDVGHGQVYMGQGTSIGRVSNMGIEDQLATLRNPKSGTGWCMAESGNLFYFLTFSDDKRTFVYDASIGKWHERAYRDQNTGNLFACPYTHGVFIGGKTYCGTNNGAALAYLEHGHCYDWDGAPILRQRVSPVYNEELNAMSLNELVIDGLVGTSPYLSGQGSNPVLMLEVSKDGGNSYGSRHDLSIGRQGNYRKLIRKRHLGRAKELVLRISITDPVPFSIYSARLDYDMCGRQ
jgi:hypothetical protein